MSEMKTSAPKSDEERWRRRDGETEIYRVCVSIIIDRIGRAGKPVLLLARARVHTRLLARIYDTQTKDLEKRGERTTKNTSANYCTRRLNGKIIII